MPQGSGHPAVRGLHCLPPVVQGHPGRKMGKGLGHLGHEGKGVASGGKLQEAKESFCQM